MKSDEDSSICNNCIYRLENTDAVPLTARFSAPNEWIVPMSSLEEAVSKGCPICKIHIEATHDAATQAKQLDGQVTISHQWLEQVNSPLGEDDYAMLTVSGRLHDLFTYEDDPAAAAISNRPTKPLKDNEESFAQMREWLTTCTAGHNKKWTHCQRLDTMQPAALPPRVIEVFRDAESNLQARLVEVPNGVGRYAALSYCWGAPPDGNPYTNILENHEEHCKVIPLGKISQTLLDAIITTDRLGLRYIWIDALCIIQDSKKDKQYQIAKIKTIFENAFVTLIAASGTTATAGFLAMPPINQDVAFSLPWGPDSTVYFRPAIRPHMQTEPINGRAWTLEERLLPPRKLIFFADHVVWECKQIGLADQGEIENMSDDMRYVPLMNRHDFTPYGLMWQIHPGWTQVVSWYARRELTFPGDKLTACGGLAQKYAGIFREQYLAGIWGGPFVLPGLLWRRIVDKEQNSLRPRPEKYRAPSWTWAAIDGKIDYVQNDVEDGTLEQTKMNHKQSIATLMKPEILSATTELKTTQLPYGPVRDGCIKLKGMLKKIRGSLTATSNEDFGEILRTKLPTISANGTDPYVDVWPDAETDLGIESKELCLLGLTGAAEILEIGALERVGTDKVLKARRGLARPKTTISFVVRGLVVAEKQPGVFSRLAYFESWNEDLSQLMNGWERCETELI